MHAADEVAHLVQRRGGGFDDQVHPVAEHVELTVGDQGGDLDQRILGDVQTGHLAVDPDHHLVHPTHSRHRIGGGGR